VLRPILPSFCAGTRELQGFGEPEGFPETLAGSLAVGAYQGPEMLPFVAHISRGWPETSYNRLGVFTTKWCTLAPLLLTVFVGLRMLL
jgi:hypothetical protein